MNVRAQALDLLAHGRARVSKARTTAPRLRAAAIAASPATPAPMTSTCAGFTRPAAVICPGKKRPKWCAASMTAR